MIPCFLGGQGSGKTTAMRLIGRLLAGPNFEVTGVQRDREDAFIAAVTNRIFLGLDNVDSKIPWLPDAFALYATGQRYRLRKLFTTNEEACYTPRAILLVSSRDPRFNRPDVTERILPLYFSRPRAYLTEEQIFSELEGRRGEIIGSLLVHIGQIADTLRTSVPKALPFRMADFASFGERVFSTSERSNEFLDMLGRLEKKQSEFAADGDGMILALQALLERSDGVVEKSVSELFKECTGIAEELGLLVPRTVQGFGQRLSAMRRVIELELGVTFTEIRGHERKRLVTIAKKTG